MNTLALCIPAYNAAEFLPRLLLSAKNQAIPFDEILVYDDCSTDDTAAVAEKHGATVISGEVNRGCSYGKNKLAEITTCNWVHFHDADDDLLPDFTTEVHKWITRKHSYDVLILNYDYVDAYSQELIGSGNYNADELRTDPLKYAIQHKIVNFGVYNRQRFLRIGGFNLNPAVLYNEDNAMHQRLAMHNLKFDYLPVVTCINYRYKNSMSADNKLKCARGNYHVLAETANTHGHVYHRELADKLHNCAAILASVNDWNYVQKALNLSKQLGHRYPQNAGFIFRVLNILNPFTATWLREKLIRLFKPRLRNG